MTRTNSQRLKYILVDLLTANIAVFIFDIARYYVLGGENIGFRSLAAFLTFKVIIIEQVLIPLLLLGINALSGYYNRPLLKSRLQELINTILVAGLQTVMVFLVLLTNQNTAVRSTNYELLFYLFLLLGGCTYLGRWMVTSYAFRKFRKGKWKYNILVIGLPDASETKAENIRKNRGRTGFSLAGIVALNPADENYGLNFRELSEIRDRKDIKEIIFATRGLEESEILKVLYTLIPLCVPVKIATDSLPILNSNIRLQSIYEEPYLDVASANVSDAVKNIKRSFDVLVSLCVLLVLGLPMAIMSVVIKCTSKGPVIFRQERIGRHRRPFTIYKFRSMRTDAEASGPQLSCEGDTRITPIGAWMRKYRVDELPQFWNVVKGDMSLVGPRPERIHFIKLIMQQAPFYSLVHQVRPGITSWGMVKYGYAKTVDEMVERLRYDLIYLANISITNDLKILIYTVKTVFKGRGV
ncbi:MAG: sugar transferase [Bacteroidales bacterium]|nr:sugar transferase [Bacteroidales bacterium]